MKKYLLILSFISVFLYIWALSVILQTFIVHPDILSFPEHAVRSLLFIFIAYMFSTLSGLIMAVLFNKKFYMKLFSFLIFLLFFTFIGAKSFFG
ncbi:MAG: hypothetical protein GXO31_07815 [Epsilonproteobacteria bacterium]|nr:hypothetical protein [Campylobacterota bacterium]